jgi:hypothetical protein
MTIDAVREIPHINVEEINEDFIRITAKDGFRFNATRVDTREGKFWRFDPASRVTAVEHFNLRYRINQALNSMRGVS